MPKTPCNIDPFLPDGATYTIAINERMRRLLKEAVTAYIIARFDDEDAPTEEGRVQQQFDDAVLESMQDMLIPEAEHGTLAPAPTVNGFVL